MPKTKSVAGQRKSKVDTTLSTRTKKQIDSLPEHAQHIFKKTHANAVKQYQDPEKRRGGKSQSALLRGQIKLKGDNVTSSGNATSSTNSAS